MLFALLQSTFINSITLKKICYLFKVNFFTVLYALSFIQKTLKTSSHPISYRPGKVQAGRAHSYCTCEYYTPFTRSSWLDELLYVSWTSQLDVCSIV